MLVKVRQVGRQEECVELEETASGAAVYAAVAAASISDPSELRIVWRGQRMERSDACLSLRAGETLVVFRQRVEKEKEETLRRFIKDEIADALRPYQLKAEASAALSAEEAANLRKQIETQLQELIAALFLVSAETGGTFDLAGALGRIDEVQENEDEDEDEDEELPMADLPDVELSLPEDEDASMIIDAVPLLHESVEGNVGTGMEMEIEIPSASSSSLLDGSAPDEDQRRDPEGTPASDSSSRAAAAAPSAPGALDITVDEASLQQLTEMGFSPEAARKALLLNQSNTEQALNWLLEHSMDADINEPLTPQQIQRLEEVQRQFTPNERAVQQLLDMGFAQAEVVQALRACDNNYEAACSWLLGDRVEGTRSRPSAPNSLLDMFSALTQGSLMKAVKHNPEMELCMRSPKTLETLKHLTKNPRKVQQYVNDPLVGCMISEIFRVFRIAFSG